MMKEGRSCDDLASYLTASGMKIYALGRVSRASGQVPDSFLFTDDEGALSRKKSEPILTALSEKSAGNGMIIMFRHPSVEDASKQIRPQGDLSLLWGRFLVVVFHAQFDGGKMEASRRQRSEAMIKSIRELLGS